MARRSSFDCDCMIAARFNSTLAVKALAELEKHDPEAVRRLMQETDEHIARLHRQCPHEKHKLIPWTPPREGIYL